jgi:hypothetical protein
MPWHQVATGPRRIAAAGSLALAALLAAVPAAAQQRGPTAQPTAWLAGAELQRQMRAIVHLEWAEVELRDGLSKLAADQGVCLFLDRRVDPGQKVTFQAGGIPLEELLQRLALQLRLGIAQIGPVTYLGPPHTAGALPTVAALRRKEASQHPVLASRRAESWRWEELAEPRQLLGELAASWQLSVANVDALPHDLWPACDFPPLVPSDRLTLLLAGFDLTYELPRGASELRLVPLPAEAEYEQAYTPRGDAARAAANLKQKVPGITIRREGSRLIIRGKFEDHETVARLLAGQTVTRRVTGATTYTMRVERQPAGAVVNTVATRLGKKMSFPPELREKLSQPVTFSVKDATLEQLLTEALSPLGLGFRITDEAIEVIAKE